MYSAILSTPLACLMTLFDFFFFALGQEEIETAKSLLQSRALMLPKEVDKLLVVPLYAALPSAAQLEAFRKPPNGCRKVVLATNIAETSITISGIKFVVDTGLVKQRRFDV